MQLYARDIIDVGSVISEESMESFLRKCYFGEDSEDSVAMALTESGKTRWLLNGEQSIEKNLNKKRREKKGSPGGVIRVEKEKDISTV